MQRLFANLARVRSKANFQKTGQVSFSVPGDGKGKPFYVVQWDDGTETTEHEDDIESEW
jgi:hypothetical protein